MVTPAKPGAALSSGHARKRVPAIFAAADAAGALSDRTLTGPRTQLHGAECEGLPGNDREEPAVQRLSRPIREMRDHYAAVVVGSGYGGAIAAARIARTGRAVCVLERGREIHPGEYPNSALSAAREIQVRTPATDHGSAAGLYEFHAHDDITVLTGCGLGGTSLINANVALEPGDSVFGDPRWPAELRDQPGILKPFMQQAKEMLGATPYPPDWPELPKLTALERAAAGLRHGPDGDAVRVTRPDLTVTFTAGPNAAGVRQEACVLCGDCGSGCNYGAKNSVLMNYLPDAAAHGAHIFTEVPVRSVRRWRDQWQVAFDVTGEGRARYAGAPAQFVTADVVVLAAGTLGSTQILLRSAAAGLPLSDRLGYGFSGNGDVLAFAYDTGQPVQGVGLGRRTPRPDTAVGPTITGLIDLRHPGADPRDALIIEEGALPGAMAAILPAALAAAARESPANRESPGGRATAGGRLRQLAGIPFGPYRGAVRRTLTYAITSTDDSGGRVVLDHDRVRVEWPGAAEALPGFVRDGHLATATEALRGTPVPDPLGARTGGRSLVTAHPLGGCVMADDAAGGVVDHAGQVFDARGGRHAGLYVCDGSVIPVALAANPLLTISALAERTADLLIRDRNWADQPADEPAGLDGKDKQAMTLTTEAEAAPETAAARLTFTERLAGFVSMHARGTFQDGYARGREDGALVEVLLTIDYADVEAVLKDPGYPAAVSGTVLAPELSPHRLTVTRGRFTLLEPDPERAETWHMRYQLTVAAEDGKRYDFDARKVIRKRSSRHVWPDTTTLYTTIRELDGPGHGSGVLRMRAADFARLLRTLDVPGLPARQRLRYRLAFGRFFTGQLVRMYGGALDAPGAFPAEPRQAPSAVREPRDPDGTWWYGAAGGWQAGDQPGSDASLRLIRYQAGPKGPVMLATGFGMSAHSFLAPTVAQNLTEYLAGAGYDVWLFDYRAGIDLPSSRTAFTIDDIARRDWPLAVAKVLAETGRDDVQAFGHCVGSVSLQMAIAAGLTGVRSAVCAQFPLHPVTSAFNQLKSRLRVGQVLRGLGLRSVAPTTARSLPNALLDTVLRLLPMPAEERCGQAVCRWINAIYGCTHRHEQLNDATHRALNDMFGVGDLTALKHLALMMRRGLAVTSDGGHDYLEHPERFGGTKLLLLQGRHNNIFRPAGTLRTLRWLREHNPDGQYERLVLPDYAHLDALVGSSAAADVYPRIAGFLDRT
jgi:cholesterol oxidase